MEDPNIGYRSRSDACLQKNRARYSGSRNDRVSRLPSTVDLIDNGWAPNPLSGPSTKQANAIEARALDMIAGIDALSETEICKNTVGLENAQTRSKHWLSLSSLSSSVQWKGQKRKANLKRKPRLSDGSDGSLVVVTAESNAGSHLSSPGLQCRSYRPLAHLSTPGRQASSFKAKITKDSPIQNLGLSQFSFGNETHLLAAGQMVVGQEQLSPDDARQERISAKNPSSHHSTLIPKDEQEHIRGTEEHSLPEDEISLLELPPPQYDLCSQGEFQNWSLNSALFAPKGDAVEAISSEPNESLVLSINTPTSSSRSASVALTNDWKYVEQDECFMGVGSPRASLMIEDIDSLIDEQVDLGSPQNTLRSPRPSSTASSGLARSDCVLPTIYPGMDQYQPSSNCTGGIKESWSNTSRSLFDSAPQYHHPIVSTPVRLRGGGGEKDPECFRVWRLFLGKKPVGDSKKGKLLLKLPSVIVNNFLLGRCGPPKSGRELCEEIEKRTEKGRDREEKKRDREEKKRDREEKKRDREEKKRARETRN